MKLSLSLALMLGIATLFQGCSGEEASTKDKKSDKKVEVTIAGATTLSSLFKKATVCVDENSDKICNENEPKTTTTSEGLYELTIDHELAEGTLLVAEGGISMLPREENASTVNEISFYKYYSKNESVKEQNINPMSTIAVLYMEDNPSQGYENTLSTLANRYDLDESRLLDDPIAVSSTWYSWFTSGPEFLEKVAALDIYLNKTGVTKHDTTKKAAANNDSTPTSDELDQILADNKTLFDEYWKALSDYIESLSTSLTSWYDDWMADEAAQDPQPEPDPDPKPAVPVQVNLTKTDLNGVWYIIDRSGDKTCSFIDGNNISVTEADGTTTNLTLSYKQIDPKRASIKLTLGFFTADTIVFDKYMNNRTFDGHYTSDGETLSGSSMTSITNCKADKLGL